MEQQHMIEEQQKFITTKELAAKANSKREIYQLLCQEAQAYLPQPTLISIYFLKDLFGGIRKCEQIYFKSHLFIVVKNEDVKHLHVPYYDSLSIKELINYGGENYPELAIYFPISKEQAKLPRQWIINVLFSTIGQNFALFVKSRTEERNQKIYVQKDLSIAIDKDVLAAFNRSSLVSIGKSATGASLLKVGSKRKRSKRDIEDEKASKQKKESEIAEKLQNIHNIEQQMQQMQAQVQANQQNTEIVNSLVLQGIASFDNNGVLNINQEGLNEQNLEENA